MLLRATIVVCASIAASKVQASQCREITKSTYVQTLFPNGAVTMSKVGEGEKFIVVNCMPEMTQVWCYIAEVSRPVFTVRRFLETDRLDTMHSEAIDMAECLAAD